MYTPKLMQTFSGEKGPKRRSGTNSKNSWVKRKEASESIIQASDRNHFLEKKRKYEEELSQMTVSTISQDSRSHSTKHVAQADEEESKKTKALYTKQYSMPVERN